MNTNIYLWINTDYINQKKTKIKNSFSKEIKSKLFLNAKQEAKMNNILKKYDIDKIRAKPYYIYSTEEVLDYVWELKNLNQESLILLTLGNSNNIINKHYISQWLLDQSLVHSREVFAPAISDRAKSIIIIHNHPSWTINPSIADISITKKLKEAGNIIWIKILDHVIIAKSDHYSFREAWMLS